MIVGKGLGNKKINRVNLSLANEYLNKLKFMANACGMKPTQFAGMLVQKALDDPIAMNQLQDKYCKHKSYRVKVLTVNGHTHYDIGERTEL